jgi:hypothetical protein
MAENGWQNEELSPFALAQQVLKSWQSPLTGRAEKR